MSLVQGTNGEAATLSKAVDGLGIVEQQDRKARARDLPRRRHGIAAGDERFDIDKIVPNHVRDVEGLCPHGQGDLSPMTSLADPETTPDMSNEILRTRIRERLKALGLTPRKASLNAKLNPTFLRDLFERTEAMPRYDSLRRLSAVLETSPEWLIGETDERPDPEKGGLAGRREIGKLIVRNKVQAGSWREQDTVQVDLNLGEVSIVPDPAYQGIEQWAELVVGDSMNLEYPEGGWIHVASAIDLGHAPRHGDHVVVERHSRGGHLVERTVKELQRQPDGGWLLVPRSTNETHKPVTFGGGDDQSELVEIVGVVLGYYRRRDRY